MSTLSPELERQVAELAAKYRAGYWGDWGTEVRAPFRDSLKAVLIAFTGSHCPDHTDFPATRRNRGYDLPPCPGHWRARLRSAFWNLMLALRLRMGNDGDWIWNGRWTWPWEQPDRRGRRT